MSLYRHKTTGEIKDLNPERIAEWLATGNEKGLHYSTEWEPFTPPQPEPDPVPYEVTRRQLFLELNALGITRAAIRAMLTGNEAALIEFEEATAFARTHPLVAALAEQLQFDSAAVDDIFRRASAR